LDPNLAGGLRSPLFKAGNPPYDRRKCGRGGTIRRGLVRGKPPLIGNQNDLEGGKTTLK